MRFGSRLLNASTQAWSASPGVVRAGEGARCATTCAEAISRSVAPISGLSRRRAVVTSDLQSIEECPEPSHRRRLVVEYRVDRRRAQAGRLEQRQLLARQRPRQLARRLVGVARTA